MVSAVRDAGLDTFVTGEGPHHTYFDAMESGINVIYAGHYATEQVGVQALARLPAPVEVLPVVGQRERLPELTRPGHRVAVAPEGVLLPVLGKDPVVFGLQGVLMWIVSLPVQVAQSMASSLEHLGTEPKLTYLERAAHVEKEYLRWFPSLNATYHVTENFLLRAAYRGTYLAALANKRQRLFLTGNVYFAELKATADPLGASYLKYARGYTAVNTLFPAALGYTQWHETGVACPPETIALARTCDAILLGAIGAWNYPIQIACWKAAPALARYQAWRSVYSMVSSFIGNDKLREALSFHTLLVGGNPMTTSAITAVASRCGASAWSLCPRPSCRAKSPWCATSA